MKEVILSISNDEYANVYSNGATLYHNGKAYRLTRQTGEYVNEMHERNQNYTLQIYAYEYGA
jgi:hypothetical protein